MYSVKNIMMLQYYKLQDKHYRDISRDIWNFAWYFETFMYLSMISSEIPIDVLRNPDWETLL
jgi:hypothetical protein